MDSDLHKTPLSLFLISLLFIDIFSPFLVICEIMYLMNLLNLVRIRVGFKIFRSLTIQKCYGDNSKWLVLETRGVSSRLDCKWNFHCKIWTNFHFTKPGEQRRFADFDLKQRPLGAVYYVLGVTLQPFLFAANSRGISWIPEGVLQTTFAVNGTSIFLRLFGFLNQGWFFTLFPLF